MCSTNCWKCFGKITDFPMFKYDFTARIKSNSLVDHCRILSDAAKSEVSPVGNTRLSVIYDARRYLAELVKIFILVEIASIV
jgi:hypothetical protein